ncbi:N-acetylneuraminate 7-O(or 9-O)-acetyltransferase [Aureococcus anophagefferens]|nr:N-acetylneuraminate 7-O(or 9-O)-acetyltransferase [Aureococcus anophagefferens]
MVFRALVGALAAVGCVFGVSPAAVAGRGGAPAAPALRSLGVKVLAQRREPELRRLLASLDAADYPDAADISVEIFVLKTARAWASTWPHGEAIVVDVKENRGVRGAWLAAYDPSVFGDEGRRAVVFEDDVVASPAWFRFLTDAVAASRGAPGVAGVSLQRQRSRLDGTARELGDAAAAQNKLAPLAPADDGLYVFGHVGPWGFSPEPGVWLAFRKWFRKLGNAVDDEKSYSAGADGTPYAERDARTYRESLVARWYRRSLAAARGDAPTAAGAPGSMWTAHFDAFCAARGFGVVHARVRGNALAFAASARSDGEHYAGVNRLDAELAGADDFAAAIRGDLFGDRDAGLPRHARGRRRSPGDDGGRGARYAACGWGAAASLATPDLLQGLHHGYAGLQTVDRDAALCVLSNTRVAILGDSIQRYFAFTLNYFLNTGEIPPEYEGDHWGPEPTDDYYDDGTTWTDDGTDRSPEKSSHRQKISAAFEGGATTTFFFIQDTWYGDLETLSGELRGGYDVLLANSGWWELKASDDDGTDCEESDMYEKGACLDAYGDEVAALYDGLLRHFQADGKMAVWRTCNCCGDTKMDAGELREGSIAVSAMNAVATQVLSDRGVEIMDVQDTADLSDVGAGDPGDPDGRTFDGGHPRAAVQYAWVQLFLNKVARKLGRDAGQRPPRRRRRRARRGARRGRAGPRRARARDERAAGRGEAGDPIDVELSGAALAVLRDMEKREAATGRNSVSVTHASASRRHRASRTSASRLSHYVGGRKSASQFSEYAPATAGRDGRMSSVAFSLYDGGDSDADESEADDVEAGAEAPPPPPPSGAKTRAACAAAAQMGLLLAACAIGESRMPAGLLPAGTTVRTENVDLWTFVMASLALASAWQMRPLEVDGGKEAALFMSRAQANEWKGWMQVAFVAYHYTNAQDVYVPIRWAVSAYVWLTGFGNGVYFWSSADFSPKRFAQQLWRMNFLCALLAMATNTAWIDYYFVALATVHFGLIFLSLGAAVGRRRCLGWAAPDRKAGREARDAEKALGVVFMVVLTVVLWVPPLLPGAQRDGARGTPYYVFDWWLAKISDHTADYFWSRTRMDYLSSIHGLLFAAVYARFRDAWPAMAAAKKGALGVCAAAALAVAVSVAKRPAYCCDGGAEYRKINAYVGPLWIPAYLLARNATPWLTNHVSRPVEWIGMHSLEFYLLQFHVLLTRKSQLVLYVIPKESWGYTNMALVTGIYVAVCVKALELTNGLHAVAWRAASYRVAAGAVWTVAAYATFEAHFDEAAHPCDGASWAVWAIFALARRLRLLGARGGEQQRAGDGAEQRPPTPPTRAPPLLDEPPLV